jgi:hypothetical protein
MVNMGVTVGIGVTVVFLAWTSSKVLYVLKVMVEIVINIIDRIYHAIFMWNLHQLNLRLSPHVLRAVARFGAQ